MVYTSYFAKLKSMPDNIIPVSICGKNPEFYEGFWYRKLAPKYDFFIKWKEDHDEESYVNSYNEQVLDRLIPEKVMSEIRDITGNYDKDIALICYEKVGDFCHRHLVADWLNKNGIECKEWEQSEKE